MKLLNILVSSTRQWNPGDEFIRFGVENLVNEATGFKQHNWILWNRNPDLFVKSWQDPRMRTDFLTNSLRDPSLDVVDLVVFAGTPEWLGKPVERIYRDLLRFPDTPVLVLGGGSGGPVRLEPWEKEILSRDQTLITTRSEELASELNAQLGIPKAVALPCPALFSSEKIHSQPANHKAGIIIQSSSVINQSIQENLVEIALQEAWAESRVPKEWICFYIDEFMRFSREKRALPVRYSLEPRDYLEFYGDYSVIVSTRLHGAVSALSCGIPSVIVSKDNYRIETTQALFSPILPSMPMQDAIKYACGLSAAAKSESISKILEFKELTKMKYLALLRPFFLKVLGAGAI